MDAEERSLYHFHSYSRLVLENVHYTCEPYLGCRQVEVVEIPRALYETPTALINLGTSQRARQVQ
jgi:hypothetical protein